MKRVIIISDCSDMAYNEMRGTIISELERNKAYDVEIEPLVRAEEFSLINASFLTRLMAEAYPPQNTILLVVVNPLRTNRAGRARIYGELKNGMKFVGENTGVLWWLVKDLGLKSIYELNAGGLTGKTFISFGGKYIHSPVAARIASGMSLKKLGTKRELDFLTKFEIPEGTIVHIDNFGVPKIKGKLLPKKEGEKVSIFINGVKKKEAIFSHCMKDLEDGTWAVYPGSSLNNLPEIGKVRSKITAKELGIKIGDIVTFK